MRPGLRRSIFLFTLLMSAAVWADAKPRVVVLAVNTTRKDLASLAETISEQVLTELGRSGRFDVMGATDIQAILGMERQRELLGCSEGRGSCLAEISAAMGAPWLVVGSVGKSGKALRLDLKVIHAADAKVVFREGRSFKDESDVFETVTAIVGLILNVPALKVEPPAAKVAPRPDPRPADAPVVAAVSPAPSAPVALVTAESAPPATPRPVLPWVVTGAGSATAVAGAIVLGAGFAQYDATRSSVQSTTPPSYTKAAAAYADANRLKGAGAVVGGLGLAVAAGGITWLMLGRVAVSAGPGSVAVSGAF